MNFPTDWNSIQERIASIDPVSYAIDRNFIDGSVSYLSPYISRGVISTKYVYNKLLERSHESEKIEKFVMELAWRDYWQILWNELGSKIDLDIKSTQDLCSNQSFPLTIYDAKTGIKAIDQGINSLYDYGYMHNHLRMYVASISCNIARSHWHNPAKWMYYHLLDGDWASNALSWQWVAGTNSHKKYFANQNNINRFCKTDQRDTFLDREYDDFPLNQIPKELIPLKKLNLDTSLPETKELNLNPDLPIALYTYYNLDPEWKQDEEMNRILIFEPTIFERYPVSKKCIDFALELSKNIEDMKIFVGSFEDLYPTIKGNDAYFKDHPLNRHFKGIKEERDWMFNVSKYYPSFFKFWKQCKKEITS